MTAVETGKQATARFDQRLPPSFHEEVQRQVAESGARAGFDSILTDDPEDVAYLCGFFFHACERPVVACVNTSDAETILLVPELEHDHALAQGVAAGLITYPEFPGTTSPFLPLAPRVERRRIGFAPSLTYTRCRELRALAAPASLEPSDVIVRARMIKRPGEARLHREAARIADLMIAAGVQFISICASRGTLPTEAEIAAHVSAVGVRTMHEEHRNIVAGSFVAGGLVYAGKNSANPHARPTDYRLSVGDTLILSLGCAVGGRHVEAERTFILGHPTEEQTRYFETVRRAQESGMGAIRPEMTCQASNAHCLNVIRDAGLGSLIRHRQGHGIGVGMHEPPWLEDGDDTRIAPGMVLSNEPGIYLPGHGGYRISDSVIVGEKGTPMTTYPKTLESCTISI